MATKASHRRYITAAKAEQLRKDLAERMDTGYRTFSIERNDWLEWYVVPDDDPRVDTYEEVAP